MTTEYDSAEHSDSDGEYGNQDDYDVENIVNINQDPEYFSYSCLKVEEVEKFLNETAEQLSHTLSNAAFQITHSLAKVILHAYKWNSQEIIYKYGENPNEVLVYSRVKAGVPSVHATASRACFGVCANTVPLKKYSALTCEHYFCNYCWAEHFEVQIGQGVSNTIQCMAQDCEVIAPEDFVLSHVTKPNIHERYQQFMFNDHVISHPQLRYCPGPNCQWLFRARPSEGARRVECRGCGLVSCFSCGAPHHAPTDCATIRRWLIKCADDSETANYITAYTRDCPNCQVSIEKNGGCNFMNCYSCKHGFCWVCRTDCRSHSGCNRYREKPPENNTRQDPARKALEKYLHYYARWENHAKSRKLEEKALADLESCINDQVMAGAGTWIDWQYLLDAARLLKRCRYTLQYTYSYAYYMEVGPRKELFEYQQAQLEAEIEKLSWILERPERSVRIELENQMDVAEKRRTTLLKDFSEFSSNKH